MALQLCIPPCIHEPAHPLHPPPLDKPLRIQIEGPLVSIQKLLPATSGFIDVMSVKFPQPVGPELARLAFQKIYERDYCLEVLGDMVVQDEYLGWVVEKPLR